jgi:hypothetical protein
MLKQFYEKALPQQGVYCVTGIDKNKKTTNRFAETLEDVYKLIEKFKKQEVNVFVALGSFDGYSRKADNCIFYRSLFIDLDVSVEKAAAGKGYTTKKEAQYALENFLTTQDLPPPVVLDSGTGIHAYWIFDEDVPIQEYLPIAEKFKVFVLDKLFADAAVMADPARIMRCPDTFNYKTDPPSPTKILSDEIYEYSFEAFKDFLITDDVVQATEDIFANVKKGLDEDTMAMKKLDNFEWDFNKLAVRSLEGDGCNQVKYWLENATELDYNDWFSSMNIAFFCKDGDQMIHEVSNEHPEYSAKAVEEKKLEFIKRGKPQTCEYLARNNPERCEGCKYRGKIHTPIVLGKSLRVEPEETTEANQEESVREEEDTQKVFTIPEFLKPFAKGVNGGIYYHAPPKVDKKGKVTYEDPVCIFAHDFYPVRRLFSPLDGECLTMRLILPNDGAKEFLLPMKSVYPQDELSKTLSFHQVIFDPEQILRIKSYLIKWSQYMIMVGRAQLMRMQLGWTETRQSDAWNKRSFVFGAQEITWEGKIVEAPYSPYIRSVAKHLKKVGTFERWQWSANQLNRPGFELHAMTCLVGFASTLMVYMSTPGVVISLLGRSGSAKTGAMYAGISTFGDPDQLSIFDSTDNGLTGRMLGLKNLVFGVDEVGNKDPKPLSNLVHKVSSGKAKIKMQASVNAERESEMIAALMAILTTNESVYNKFEILKGSPDGELARLIEFLIEQPNDLKGVEGAKLGKEIFNAFKFNYGHAGPMFIQEVYKLGDEYVDQRISYWTDRYLVDTGGDSTYRFHQNFVAAVMTAGDIAVNASIVDYDLERIYQRIIKELNNIKNNVVKFNSTDYDALLNDFMYEHMGNILRIKEGKVTDEPRGRIVARICTDEPTRVSKPALKEFLQERNISVREFEKHMLESKHLLEIKKGHLEKGWKPTTGMKGSYLYHFDNEWLHEPQPDN